MDPDDPFPMAQALERDVRMIAAALARPGPLDGLADQLELEPCWLEDVALNDEPGAAREVLVRALHDPRLAGAPHLTPKIERRLAAVVGWGLGDWIAAEALLVSALEALHWARDSAATAAVATQLAWLRGASGDLEGQLAAAREIAAAERARGPGDRSSRAAAAAAWAAAWSGRPVEVEALLPDPSEDAMPSCPTALAVYALSCSLAGRPADAVLSIHRIAAGGDLHPAAVEATVVTSTVAGRPGDVVLVADERARWCMGPADPRRTLALALSVVAAVEADDGMRAGRLMDELERLRGHDADDVATRHRWARLMLCWQENGARAAAGALVDLVAGTARRWTALDALAAAAASAAAREAGDADAAARLLAALESAAARSPAALIGPVAAIARGDAALLGVAGPGFERPLPDVTSALEDVGAAGLAASARAVDGRLAEAEGRRDEAIARLARAAADLQRLGGRRALTAVLADLAALGQDGRRAAAALGGAALTGRELEIARMAAGGLTAQAIADRLVISRRTVETHLAHTYAKLAVSGRRELERRAHELGLR